MLGLKSFFFLEHVLASELCAAQIAFGSFPTHFKSTKKERKKKEEIRREEKVSKQERK